MKLLLFGGHGQLGREIWSRANELRFEITAPSIDELDITDFAAVEALIAKVGPNAVVNAAAYTQVDKAEDEPELAQKINGDAPGVMARAAKKAHARFVHISTDYVFEGRGRVPLTEEDQVAPLSVYGRTKLAGEEAVKEVYPEGSVTLRTAWVHGRYGENFVQSMLRIFPSRDTVYVVNDQFGSPTWAGWLAEVVLDVMRLSAVGLYHAACAGEVSRFDFARILLELVRGELKGAERTKVLPCSTAEFPRPAERPAYAVLDCNKLAKLLERDPLPWNEGLKAHLRELGYLQRKGSEETVIA